mmetsp:Transcript_13054/g.24994  ORF Transcript_13054/g.24994 Transcript_13054/m.24994 type:complete len:113 (+) Transcript_13054:275-613(+)
MSPNVRSELLFSVCTAVIHAVAAFISHRPSAQSFQNLLLFALSMLPYDDGDDVLLRHLPPSLEDEGPCMAAEADSAAGEEVELRDLKDFLDQDSGSRLWAFHAGFEGCKLLA